MKHSWQTLKNGKQRCRVCKVVASHEEPYPQDKHTGCRHKKNE